MNVELVVKGDIKRLHLDHGDKVVVELEDRVSRGHLNELQGQLQKLFPLNEVLVIAKGEFSIVRHRP